MTTAESSSPSAASLAGRRSMVTSVSSLGCDTTSVSRSRRAGRAVCSRACSITSAADSAAGARSASTQRPSFSMRIGTAS